MCGLFGFCGSKPDNSLIQETAYLAATRGPHAYGFLWTDEKGINTRKGIGRLNPSILQDIRPALLIGHCRLSTSGTYRLEQNNQPILCGDIAVSHNGNIPDYKAIADKMGIDLRTQCDSEILCHIAGRYGIEESIKATNGAPTALLLLQNNCISVFRKKLPLYVMHTDGGFYFCSRAFGSAEQIPENEIITFEGGIVHGSMQHGACQSAPAREKCQDPFTTADQGAEKVADTVRPDESHCNRRE